MGYASTSLMVGAALRTSSECLGVWVYRVYLLPENLAAVPLFLSNMLGERLRFMGQ